MDYLVTVFFIIATVFGGYFYGCNVQQWCGQQRTGVPLQQALQQAQASDATAQDDAMRKKDAKDNEAQDAHDTATKDAKKTKDTARKDTKDAREKADASADAKGADVKVAAPVTPTPITATHVAQAVCAPYIVTDIRPGRHNDKQDVIRLEKFLNTYEGEKLVEGGVYDGTDQAAVKRFQKKYADDILAPAGLRSPTGLVLDSTRKKINALYCAHKKR